MHEFETFVYLDVEKTGSTFIVQLLKTFAKERYVRGSDHTPADTDPDRSKFHFASVRAPLDAYLSLYSFGCGNSGTLRARLERAGRGALYDGTLEGFSGWLGWVLNPRHADALGRIYSTLGDGALAQLLGFQSYRFLRLALADGRRVLARCRTKDDVRAAWAEHRLAREVVRNESLACDLARLLRGPLAHAMRDVEEAVRAAESPKRVNASQRVDKGVADFTPSRRLMRRLSEREWFLCETFGY